LVYLDRVRRGSIWGGLLCTAIAVVTITPGHSAPAAPPSDPECLPLVAGTTGLIYIGGLLPSPDQLAGEPGGFGPPAGPAVAATLPDKIPLKTNRLTFSEEYAFALRAGRVYVRPARVGRAEPSEPWRLLELPQCLDGHVREISADGRLLLAIGDERQLYSNDMPGGDISAERWTWRWGPYFWTGSGLRIWRDVTDWAASDFNSNEFFTDSSGRERHPIGVATVYLLRGGGRRITYIDPWLPNDDSREVCGPRRGSLPLAGLSGSGSTVFVVARNGALFTRIYDFDVTGANTVFGDYSWQRGRPPSDGRWQLPGPGWVRHTPPPGTITDRISVARTGLRSRDRLLRVEGRDHRGRPGYFQKPIAARRWHFVPTGARLLGRRLPFAEVGWSAPDDRYYAGTIAGRRAQVLDFNPECSPAKLRVSVAPGVNAALILHTSDGLRQDTRSHGLNDTPREYNGAIEVPPSLDPRARAWVEGNLGSGRFFTSPLAVTTTRMRFLSQCWELTLGGHPARPDQPPILPDLGAIFARLTERIKDNRPPVEC
jgi:hypothetical protein